MSRIVIAEDEDRLAAFIDKGLRKNGFATLIATDGEQAILMSQSSDVDLVLLDLGLPIKDGWTVLRELRCQGEQKPIIIVTANDDDGNRTLALKLGANDYVTKPFGFNDLLTRIRTQLDNIS